MTTTVWAVLVHPYHDYLIDIRAFDDEALAHAWEGEIEEARSQRRELWDATRDTPGVYNENYPDLVATWTPLLGKRIADELDNIEYVEVRQLELHTIDEGE